MQAVVIGRRLRFSPGRAAPSRDWGGGLQIDLSAQPFFEAFDLDRAPAGGDLAISQDGADIENQPVRRGFLALLKRHSREEAAGGFPDGEPLVAHEGCVQSQLDDGVTHNKMMAEIFEARRNRPGKE